ncbi:hypothetical protein [Wenyingzhuangia sp. IMCC45574]
MEKSIENIWKDSFSKSNKLIAPKLNNLYNQKSVHIVDRYIIRIKTTMIFLMASASIALIATFFIGIPIIGILAFLTITGIVIVNKRLLKELVKIDMVENSYNYIKAFYNWLKKSARLNRKIAVFFYPLVFLFAVLINWYTIITIGGAREILGEDWYDEIVRNNPNIIFRAKMILISLFTFLTLIIAYFGGKIYDWDMKITYGSIHNKLDEILSDMEELRS